MTQNQLGNARNRAIDRIVGMLESPDFDPGNDKNQRQLFDALCKAHASMVAHYQQIRDANRPAILLRELTGVLSTLDYYLKGEPDKVKIISAASRLRTILEEMPLGS